jgi:Domain of unknown function (DUF3783)
MTCQLSHKINCSVTTSTPASSSLVPIQRYFRKATELQQRKTSLSGGPSYKNWSSFHNTHEPHPRPRLSPPHANPFDSFLDNVRKVTNNSLQPDFSIDDGSSLEVEESSENENTFVKLDPNSTGSVDGSAETTFGPLAMLAVGFLPEEFAALQQLLDDIGADEVNLIPCTEKIIKQNKSLGEALSLDPPPPFENTNFSFSSSNTSGGGNVGTNTNQKVIFLSGMYASEVIEVVGAIRECDGVPDCAFAAAVPNSWGRKLKELVEDVFADHAAMAERRAQQLAQMEADRASLEQED